MFSVISIAFLRALRVFVVQMVLGLESVSFHEIIYNNSFDSLPLGVYKQTVN
jgi:hypothetical protein